MGQLKPGATYIYESPDGGETTYAREMGSTDRVLIGQTYKARSTHEKVMQDQLWHNIRQRAETHPGLAEELERVIIFYRLLEDSEPIMWHPV